MDFDADNADMDPADYWKGSDAVSSKYEEYALSVRTGLARIRSRYKAEERIPPEGFLAMDINAYIASCTNYSHYLEQESDRLRILAKTQAIAYIRDTFNATTYGEALEVITNRKITQPVIELWIEQKMLGRPEIAAINRGYPELSDLTEGYRFVNGMYQDHI